MNEGDDESPSCSTTVAGDNGVTNNEQKINTNNKSLSKRAAVKQRIEQYYFQVTEGCGRNNCSNPLCASAPDGLKTSGNAAAVKALELFKSKAKLCELNPRKIARTDLSKKATIKNEEQPMEIDEPLATGETSLRMEDSVNRKLENITVSHTESKLTEATTSDTPVIKVKEIPYLNEDIINSILTTEEENESNKYVPLIRILGQVFSSVQSLNRSFIKQPLQSDGINKNKDSGQFDSLSDVKFEHQYQKTAQKFSKLSSTKHFDTKVNLEALRRAYAKILPIESIQNALVNSLLVMSTSLKFEIKRNSEAYKTNTNLLNVFIIIMENVELHSPEYLEEAFPAFCMAMAELPLEAQATLARIWSTFGKEHMKRMVEVLQQLITFKVVCNECNAQSSVNEEENVIAATKCLRIFYYASILGGELDQEYDPNGAVPPRGNDIEDPVIKDPLSDLLNVSPTDSVAPLIPFIDFINDSLNDSCEVAQDYLYSKNSSDEEQYFSYFGYPFVFNTATKTTYLFYDNKVRMTSERRLAMISNFMLNMMHVPYLKLKVRRDHVVEDALLGLEITVMDNPEDLRKQLFVEFEGEQGVDEGGVSKEFFQLVVERLFDPVYGMFTYNSKTTLYWFNHAAYFDSFAEYKLIGILLGLAIYNNCILDIRFPRFVYKKLMGKKARFDDMKESHPELYSGLCNLLEYKGDVEEDMVTSFVVGYCDSFGSLQEHELKENGKNIPVTNDNRKEYVELYANWLLNESLCAQFTEFRRGFELVVRDAPIKHLFLPDEIELIICGSEVFDFKELEVTTEYDGGFTATSKTIVDFWHVVHEMSEEEQRNLLQFTTGTNRAPVGGLSKIKMIIAKNGPDSNRLPTAHTCFNVLLLPNYENREKLKERLLKAIKYSQGFGML